MDDSQVGRFVASRDAVRSVYNLLRESWWIVVVCALVGACAALGYSVIQPSIYRANSVLYVTSAADSNAQAAYQGSLASQQRVASYAQLATSEEVLSDGLSKADLSLAMDSARKDVSAASIPDTVLLVLSAKNSDPHKAVALVNGVATSLVDYVGTLEVPNEGGQPLAKLTVVSAGQLEPDPVSPNTTRNVLLFLVVGVMLGLGAVLLRARLDTRIQLPEDVAVVFDHPVLGSIPADEIFTSSPVLDFTSGAGRAIECFRKIRTSVSFLNVDEGARVLVVTSSLPGEGKTTVSANLAVSLAEAGKRVLLIDGDLRRPQIARVFGLGASVGLTECITGAVRVEDVIQPSSYDGLYILSSGTVPPNPSELLDSDAARRTFVEISSSYDSVIVDSPPLLPAGDALVLSKWADGVLFVVRAGGTRRADLLSAARDIENAHATVLGSIMNGVSAPNDSSYGYYGATLASS